MQRILIVGATSRIAEHCARLWARQPCRLVLAGRDIARLENIAQDLRVRSPGSDIVCRTPSFEDPAAIDAFVREVFADGGVDVALVAHGNLPDQGRCQEDLALVRAALEVNAVSPVLFAEALAGAMQAAGRGSLAVIGSVAGDRGRRSNYVYGAAKGLVDRYLQGMQHRFAGGPVRVTIIKPGPTDTPMTERLRSSGARLADPARVAQDICAGIASGKHVVYTPGIWRWIMLVIRHIPDRAFARLNI
jgi:hypothetical protein